MIETNINSIFQIPKGEWEKKRIKIKGWVRSIRNQKKWIFITINDGSTANNLQVVISSEDPCWEQARHLNYSSGLIISGELIITPNRSQSYELRKIEILWTSLTAIDCPLQKQRIPLEILRDHPQIRNKTQYFLNIFRLRHFISKYINDFFFNKGFYNIPSPILTENDSEGAGETFFVTTNTNNFFLENQAKLTVSGQLHLESLSQGLGKVYSFNPCFRAEKSHTNSHLAEFWMVEAEMISSNLFELTNLTEALIKKVIENLLTKNTDELQYFEKYNENEIIDNLNEIISKKFKKMTYSEVINFLKEKKPNNAENDLIWGDKLNKEHEKYISEYFNCPIFITNYPKKIKAFYMKDNEDEITVENFDLIVPRIGELAGGSLREDNYQLLNEKIKNFSNQKKIEWYLNLRKFGYLPTGGFGLGFERLIMWISGAKNIRDVIPFPRYFNSLPC